MCHAYSDERDRDGGRERERERERERVSEYSVRQRMHMV